ncbi:hypothetical protein AK812_SmicGene47408, partial [Symbiodinium microadriaticum]
ALILEEVVQIYRHRGAVGFFAGAGYRAVVPPANLHGLV